MHRLIRLLRWLSVLVVVAGLTCFYLLHEQEGFAGIWFAWRQEMFAALGKPMALATLALALGSSFLALLSEKIPLLWPAPRYGARRRGSHRKQRPTGEPPMAAPSMAVAGGGGSAEESELASFGRQLGKRVGSGRRMIRFVDELLAGAVEAGASDIHIQPSDRESMVSLRIGGRLVSLLGVPASLHSELIRRLKILGDLVAYQSQKPQDGRFTLASAAGTVDVRLSVVPSHHGERAALRLALQGAGSSYGLVDLGMPPELLESYLSLLARPQGLLVLNGPTGCGKTTTIYASLEHIHQSRGGRTHIATLEDPVEVDLPYLQQTEAKGSSGLGFAEGLRALLRQDPNVLMVGEIRDGETAATAIQAGLSGHLILTTLHADSSAGVFNRLIDMGVEPFRVASAILACLSQRLVRGLCPDCRQPVLPRDGETPALGRLGVLDLGQRFYAARGCNACHGTGFRGRVALFELLTMTPELRQGIADRLPTPQLQELAIEEGMEPLRAMAVTAAQAGRISLQDLIGAV